MTEKNEPKIVELPKSTGIADVSIALNSDIAVSDLNVVPAEIEFHVTSGANSLRITPEGFFINGKKVEADAGEARLVFDAFKDWLADTSGFPRFRYYILDTFDGAYKGTNNEETAKSYTHSDDHFVVDAHLGMFMPAPGEVLDVEDVD